MIAVGDSSSPVARRRAGGLDVLARLVLSAPRAARGSRRSTSASEGITFSFSEARAIGQRQRDAEHRLGEVGRRSAGRQPADPLERRREESGRRRSILDEHRREEPTPSGVGSSGGWRASALEQRRPASAARCRRYRGSEAWPATPWVRSREPEDFLLAERERVEAPAAELDRDPAALVDDEVAADQRRGAPRRAIGRLAPRPLLVGGRHHQQLAARRAPTARGRAHRGGELGRDLALHVERAAAPDLAVVELAAQRAAAPLLGVGGHGVDVTEQAQGRARRRPAQPRDEVGALGLGGRQLAVEARLARAFARGTPPRRARCRAG